MHIRVSQLNVFQSAVRFDASGTLAGRIFEHIEAQDIDEGTVMVVMAKVNGRRRFCGSRRDGRFLMFDMADGSILGYCPWHRLTGGVWLFAVENRTAAEIALDRGLSFLPMAMHSWEPAGSDQVVFSAAEKGV